MRRTRRDGPLDIVFVLFNADGMGGTARSGIAQANALLSLGEGHRVRILSVTRSGARTHYPLADGLEVTYLVDVRGERPAAVSGQPPRSWPTSWPSASRPWCRAAGTRSSAGSPTPPCASTSAASTPTSS